MDKSYLAESFRLFRVAVVKSHFVAPFCFLLSLVDVSENEIKTKQFNFFFIFGNDE